MEIIDERENLMFFEDVDSGRAFTFENACYLKITPIETKTGAIYNAICLENGDVCIFGEYEPVLVVEATLTIK